MKRGAALVGERTEQLADLDYAGRIKAVSGLVEHEQFGGVQQRAGESETLFVAERELPGTPIGIRIQSCSVIQSATDRGGEPVSRRWMSRFPRTVRLG